MQRDITAATKIEPAGAPSPMKILFLVSSMEGGGAERVAALLSNAWAERGCDVALMPTFSGRGRCVYPLSPLVQLRYLADEVGPNPNKLSRLKMLRRIIVSDRPDVIISFLPHVNVAAILAAAGLAVPVIASERIYPPLALHTLSAGYRVLRQLTYPFAAALVGQTAPAANWLRKRSMGTKVAVIPNPVLLPIPTGEPVLSPDRLVSADRRILLWVGRFEEQKRPDLMIEAFVRSAATMPEWNLVMLGEGPLRPAIEEAAERNDIAERVHLPGFVGNLADWYGRASLFAMTSSFEGFPNTLLEAMAHGTPSIAFDVLTGPRELSDQGRRLILLPDHDQLNALANTLSELASDSGRLQTLGEAAREVAGAYSEEAVLAMWDDLFAACLPATGQAAQSVRRNRNSEQPVPNSPRNG